MVRPRVVIVLRTTDDVLRWAGRLVDPPLRTAIGRLPEPSREVAELQLGWHLGDDVPAASLRSALTLVCADAVGGDPHDAVPGAVAVELMHHWSAIRRDLVDERADGTAWSVLGPEPASLGGEALLALAFDVIATGDPTHHAPARPRQRSGQAGPDRAMLRVLGDTVQELLHGQHASLALRDSRTSRASSQVASRDAQASSGVASRGPQASSGVASRDGQASSGVASRDAQASSEVASRDAQASSGVTARGARASSGVTARDGRGEVVGEERTDLLRDCLAMVEQRTGALFGCACALGAVAGGGDAAQVERLRLFGVRLGLAVQFIEDLGSLGSDLRRRRRSLPVAAAIAAGADELADLFDTRTRIGDADVERAAKTIEQSGARDWCRRQAEELLSQALLALDLASPPAAVAELVSLARRATATPR
ncbi:polyprenyl synthetase family protein [Dactylosporangium sp. CS-033363]|uniref:polyprenyl synthetase family protein n=1 Tax=Dactylosporangium sp. CS-033363 TaxID=3239935 RepID=UPI003D8F5BF8